jgi:hypothetical protein
MASGRHRAEGPVQRDPRRVLAVALMATAAAFVLYRLV